MNNSSESRIIAICDRFEDLWQSGKPPSLADFTGGENKNLGAPLIEALLKIDIQCRQKNGLDVIASAYEALGKEAVEITEQIIGEVDLDQITPLSSDPDQSESDWADLDGTVTGPPPVKASSSQQIGPYKLLQQIGEGGMGTVWMAEQEKPVRRRVALKLIKGAMADKQIIARFEAERQALAMMDHQNIAKVLDAGTTETGNPYFVMELVNGIPINEYCDRNKLTPNERLKLFVPVCKAVQHAHQKGIIHRDLKPSNVLVQIHDGQPVARVIDFGLAKALQHQTKLTDKTMFTEFGQIVGTLQYMSPEQAKMDALNVDTRSDIYSLGVMLYELLAGSTPVDRETLKNNALLKVLELIRESEPPKPSHRLSSSGEKIQNISELRQIQPSKLQQILRGELDWIVMKALEKDRTRRYETANDFAEDIDRYLNGDVVEARPPSAAYKLQKFAQKNRGLVATLTTIAALLVAGVGVSSWFAVKANIAKKDSDQKTIEVSKERDRANEKEALARQEANRADKEASNATRLAQQADEEAERARVSENVARKLQSDANFQLAQARWNADRVGDARRLLDEIPEEYRNFEWYYSARQFLGSDVTCYGHQNFINSVAYSPDGTRIASGSSDRTIKLWDAVSGEELKTLRGHADSVLSIAFSLDGRRIVSGSTDNIVKFWDAASGTELQTLNLGHADGVESIAFSSDGRWIASGGKDGLVKLWNAQNRVELRTLSGHTDKVNKIAISPDGTRIASVSSDGTLKLWDAATGAELQSIRGHQYVACVAFSPDGTRVASGGRRNSAIKIWDATNGQLLNSLGGAAHRVNCLQFSPDGSRIASGSSDNTTKLWDVITGKELHSFHGHTWSVSSMQFSPDGSRLASGSWDCTIKLWDVINGERQLTLTGSGPASSVAFSPDATFVASGNWDSTIELWGVHTGQKIHTFRGHTDRVESIAFSPNGKLIVSGSKDKTINLWDVASGDKLKSFKGHQRPVTGVDFSPDGTKIASGSNYDKVKIWDAFTGQERRFLGANTVWFTSIAYSPDGTQIAAGGQNNLVKLWDAVSGQELHSLQYPQGFFGVVCIAFSPDGTQIAGGNRDATITLWGTANGESGHILRGHTAPVESIAFSPDGTRIVSGSTDNSIKIWDVANGEELQTLGGHPTSVTSVAFSPDGRRIASCGGYGTIKLWVSDIGRECQTLRGDRGLVLRVAFSPDGKLVASSSADKAIKIWDVVGKRILLTLSGDTWAPCLAFSPDCSRIATGHNDKIIKIWDTTSGQEILNLTGHTEGITSVAFSPDGTRIYSEDSSGARTVWNSNNGAQVKDEEWAEQVSLQSVSPDRRWLAVPSGSDVLLVDLEFKSTPREKAYRVAKARLNPFWHRQQAVLAEKEKDWFAATFHWAWVMKTDSSQAENYDILHDCYEALELQTAENGKKSDAYFAPIVKEMLNLPRGEQLTVFSENEAKQIDSDTWNRARRPISREELGHSDRDMDRYRSNFIKQYPRGVFYRTLAAAEFRMGNCKEAIEAALKSLELTPTELNLPGPFPGDFAILSMSHFKLAEKDKAKDYRQKLNEAMKLEVFKDDNDCKSFAAEVEQLFSATASDTEKKN